MGGSHDAGEPGRADTHVIRDTNASAAGGPSGFGVTLGRGGTTIDLKRRGREGLASIREYVVPRSARDGAAS